VLHMGGKHADANDKDNPFMRLHRKKFGGNIFKALARFAEQQHFEIIKERANLRYQGEADGVYKCFTWGVGMHGRLGHGYNISYATPQPMMHLGRSQVLKLSLGAHHSIACTYDGSVLSWGNGQYGQLGNGQSAEDYKGVGVNISMTPKAVAHLKRYFVVSVAAGRWHNLALVNDRTVWAWGDNKFGQLGLDHFVTQGIPRQVTTLDGRCTCSIHCGSWHSAAINESGKMFLWGKNSFGQVGDGSVKTRNHPYLNSSLRSIGKVRTCALGAHHSVVVLVANLVYSFGRGDKGQLGLPKIDDYHPDKLKQEGSKASYKIQVVPAEIVDLTNCNICQVSAGDTHTLALSVFGEVWSFGGSEYGQLGHGNIVDIRLPTPILPQRHNIPANIRHVCAGYTFSMAATDTGELYSWGQGESGELGHSAKILMYAPTEVAELRDVRYIAAGHRHAAAITFTAALAHLGADSSASGEAEASSKSKPSASRAGKSSAAASSRGSASSVSDNNSQRGSTKGSRSKSGIHSHVTKAIKSKQATYALVWGEDTCGQLGMRGLQAARSPTLMRALAVGDTSVTSVAASADATAFVTNQGHLYMCGGGAHGKLGLGHLNLARSPMQVMALSSTVVVEVACGLLHTICLDSIGGVYAWGDSTWGNTCANSQGDFLEPVLVKALSACDIANVVCGHYHSFARSIEGTLYAWGKNTNGQLGIGTVTLCETAPQKVSLNAQVLQVSGGGNHSCIVGAMSPPNLFTFGMNANGQLGLDDQVS
jgi:alpha-tubulin suppressor-like RCC1 family protein